MTGRPGLRLLLTRPQEEAEALAERLRQQGHVVAIAPMLAIRFLDDAVFDFAGVQALLLTSANGVRALARRPPLPALPVYAVGRATADAARAAGFANVESADGDGAALAALARDRLDPEAGPLAHVSGRDVAGDGIAALREAGFEVRGIVAYEAVEAEALGEEGRRALAAGVDGVLLFSPRTARRFVQVVQEADLAEACRNAEAVCLSPAVAEAAGGLPWRSVRVAERPDLAALLPLVEEVPAAASAPLAPPAAGPERRRGGGRVALFVVVAFLAGMALWPVLGPLLAPYLAALGLPVAAGEGERLAALEARLAAREARPAPPAADPAAADRRDRAIAALSERVDRLEARPAGVARADLEALKTRLDALAERPQPAPQAPAADGARLAALAGQVDELRQRLEALAALEARLSAADARFGEARAEAALAAERVDKLAQEVAKLAGEAGAIGGGMRRQALVLAVGQLRDAATAGLGYGAELETARALAGKEAALLEPLDALAAQRAGVPTFEALAGRFPAVAEAVLAAARQPDGGGWWERTQARLGGLVSLRRVGEVAGDAPDAVVARIERRLAEGDLAKAVAEAGGLAGPQAEAAAPWLKDAQARLAVDAALRRLQVEALQRAGGQ